MTSTKTLETFDFTSVNVCRCAFPWFLLFLETFGGFLFDMLTLPLEFFLGIRVRVVISKKNSLEFVALPLCKVEPSHLSLGRATILVYLLSQDLSH